MEKISFLKQREKNSCGPIAILNTKLWANIPIKTQEISKYKKLMNIGKHGVTRNNFAKALTITAYEHNNAIEILKTKEQHLPTIENVDSLLNNGHLVILDYYPAKRKEYIGHFCLITKRSKTGKSYFVINHHGNENKNNTWIRRSSLEKKFLKPCKNSYFPHIWSIKRGENSG